MIILLFSVLFWFVSFNAVETFNSLFCKEILGNDKINGIVVIVLTVSSIVTFLASMNLAFKIGRKNCILLGLGLIILGYIGIIIMLATKGAFKDSVTSVSVTPAFTVLFLVMIAICGVGWALINVNSYPIMVEMSSRNNIGKYTGYYYTFSMTAQSITPIVVGLIMSFNSRGLKLLYPYSLLTMVIALVIFIFFKENKKAVAQIKRGFESLAREDD
jgi:MFS family permease